MRAAPFFPPHPPYAARGERCWVVDVDGRHLLDCANNFFSLVHGHAFPPVIEALHRTLDRGTAFGLPTPFESDLAEVIAARSPRLEHVRFANSGTEAVMFCIKAARAITGRPMIAKFEGAYHGAYDPVEVSLDPTPENWGQDDPASVPYAKGTPASVTAEVVVLPFNDAARCAAILDKNAGRLAAVVMDPLASRVAMVPAAMAVRDAVQEACRRHGILLIVDEVVSYRLGYGGAHALYGLEPDLVALGKVIGGGLPVGAVAGPAAAMAVFDHTAGKPPVSHGGTFSANPLTMVAGRVALEHLTETALTRLNALGDRLRNTIARGIAASGLPAQVTGTGSFFRMHLKSGPITDFRTARPDAAQAGALRRVHMALLERGFLLAPNCSGALSTPMGDVEIDDLASAIGESLRSVWTDQQWQ